MKGWSGIVPVRVFRLGLESRFQDEEGRYELSCRLWFWKCRRDGEMATCRPGVSGNGIGVPEARVSDLSRMSMRNGRVIEDKAGQ